VRRLEAALEQSRRLAALGELAASLAHEIRNPLGAISGSFQLLASRTDQSADEHALVGIVERELHRLDHLVNDVLDYARPSRHNPLPTDIVQLVRDTFASFVSSPEAAGKRATLDLEDSTTLVFEVDGSRLRQVLWNLLRNAAQATELGTEIRLSLRGTAANCLIEVADNGRGIAEGDTARIFDPFFSTRERGLGLGLAVCKRIIEEHGGTIEAQRREGGGALFRVVLSRP